MSVLEWRGGFPVPFRIEGLTTTAVEVVLGTHLRKLDHAEGRYSRGFSKWLHIQNHDVNVLKVYFFEGHADSDVHFVEVYQGIPWSAPAEVDRLWVATKSGTTDCEITAFFRRG